MPRKHTEPIPDIFSSLTEAADFWDSHDTMEYPDALHPVGEATTDLRGRYDEVEVEVSVARALHDKARERGVTVRDLATELLRRELAALWSP